ncbi:protein TIFY 5A-like [Salvia divinorum]|uniref:Protein TIFY n=1 Tax=Salvia divinorum TaxID=28513 RepID=A0ABD1HL50_SALDI
MKRNCNLELRLLTPSVSFHLSDRSDSMLDMNESPNKTQQLTIFYNGKVASCDATELQARTIISLASGEMEGKWSKNSPAAAAMNSPVYGAATGLSMKGSLQRFLEKRKTRAQSISPYSITRH